MIFDLDIIQNIFEEKHPKKNLDLTSRKNLQRYSNMGCILENAGA